MRKIIYLMSLVLFLFNSGMALAKVKKHKKTAKHSKSKIVKGKKKKRKNHGTGPDLKAITTEPVYKEDPQNGVTPVEKKE